MQTSYDALIVGGGPAGATAATLLSRAGWSVAVIEKQAFPRRKVCGECIAASNLPLLKALGIDIAMFEAMAGAPLRRVAVLHGARQTSFDMPKAPALGMEWGRALGRETLDSLLMALARDAGAAVWQPWAVDAIEGKPGAFRCTLHDTKTAQCTTFTAPIVILANGSWELLPAQREQRRLQRRPSDLFAFKANFRDSALAPGWLPVLSFPGGYGGMVVADAGVMTLACCVRADRLEALRRASPGCSAGAVVEAMLRRECCGVEAALSTAVRDQAWIASGPLHPGIHLRQDDWFFRIGNAAAEAHPIIGEGMSMAMQSAWLLCDQLLAPSPHTARVADGAGGTSEEAALWQRATAHRYATAWRSKFALRLRIAAVLAHAAMRPQWCAPLLRLAERWPAVVTRGVDWCGKTRTVPDAATIMRLASRANVYKPMPAPVPLCSEPFSP